MGFRDKEIDPGEMDLVYDIMFIVISRSMSTLFYGVIKCPGFLQSNLYETCMQALYVRIV